VHRQWFIEHTSIPKTLFTNFFKLQPNISRQVTDPLSHWPKNFLICVMEVTSWAVRKAGVYWIVKVVLTI